MPLSLKNIEPILLDLNQNIEDLSEATVRTIFEHPDLAASFYPPNGGLTSAETTQLLNLSDNTDLRNALRKILADNAASVVFQLLSVLDGVADPKNGKDDFSDVRLQDEINDPSDVRFQDMLHDSFLDYYWDWQKLRQARPWKLDNYNT